MKTISERIAVLEQTKSNLRQALQLTEQKRLELQSLGILEGRRVDISSLSLEQLRAVASIRLEEIDE